MNNIQLQLAEDQAKDDIKNNRAGFACMECGSFWTMTGWGKEWHEPGCPKDKYPLMVSCSLCGWYGPATSVHSCAGANHVGEIVMSEDLSKAEKELGPHAIILEQQRRLDSALSALSAKDIHVGALKFRISELEQALENIRELDPNKDSCQGCNEWGEADCFILAKDMAEHALAHKPKDD